MKTVRSTIAILAALALHAEVPKGFKKIFNGKDSKGWHISEVNHHGNTKAWSVKDGVLMVTQEPAGNGGILLTDKKYKNFEVSIEVKPDWGCDGGLFLRANEKGQTTTKPGNTKNTGRKTTGTTFARALKATCPTSRFG